MAFLNAISNHPMRVFLCPLFISTTTLLCPLRWPTTTITTTKHQHQQLEIRVIDVRCDQIHPRTLSRRQDYSKYEYVLRKTLSGLWTSDNSN
jgi:hypothetical protein